jgi:hypothetical protein
MARYTLSFCFIAAISAALLAGCTGPPLPPVFNETHPLTLPPTPAAEGPRLSLSDDGQLSLSWMERGEHGGTLRFTTLEDGEWQAARTVVQDPDMFVNWADIPSVVPLSGDRWLAHWMSKSAASTYAYDVLVSRSDDAGSTWSAPTTPHDDGTPTEHGFVSISGGEDDAHLLWLDGRKTGNEYTGQAGDTSMTLRAASIDSQGVVSNSQLVDDMVCDCCRTDMVMTSSGRIAVYRNRTSEEIRDIYIAHQVDGVWQAGTPLADDGWEISGCPVNGPAIAAEGDLVAVAWFSAADDQPVVKARISTNGGHKFGEPILISNTNVIGQVDIEILDSGAVAVAWLEKNRRFSEEQIDVNIVPVTIKGHKGLVSVVGRTIYNRTVPQMRRFDDELIFVWTDIANDTTKLASVRMGLVTEF